MTERPIGADEYNLREHGLWCPNCGWEVTDLLCAHPRGFAGAVAVMFDRGLVCCGHVPTLEETKVWARVVYAARPISGATP
jgi:hypothetical protein